MKADDDVSDDPLTAREVASIRRLLLSDDRARWFWSAARIWAGWIVGAPVAVLTAWQAIQHLFGGGVK